MFDGLGGANGRLPHEFMQYTAEQVEAWWLRPLEAVRKANEAGGDKPATVPHTLPSPMTMSEFRGLLAGRHADKPDDWWEQKLAEFNAAAEGARRGEAAV